MAQKPAVTIIGPGRLGRSLATALASAGYLLQEIVFRNSRASKKSADELAHIFHANAVTLQKACFDADITWLCVPDGEITPTAGNLMSRTNWKRRIVFHSSGALTSDALQILREQGASVASVHPLMTFVHGSDPTLQGVPFGLEGDRAALRQARQIIKVLGGDAFLVRKKDKALYHAWGTFLSPLLLAHLVTAEQVARATGMTTKIARNRMLRIAAQTLANYAALGATRSFSGPLVRGDAEIIGEHLQVLKKIPEAREAYIALARSALRHLPVRNREKIERVLERKI